MKQRVQWSVCRSVCPDRMFCRGTMRTPTSEDVGRDAEAPNDLTPWHLRRVWYGRYGRSGHSLVLPVAADQRAGLVGSDQWIPFRSNKNIITDTQKRGCEWMWDCVRWWSPLCPWEHEKGVLYGLQDISISSKKVLLLNLPQTWSWQLWVTFRHETFIFVPLRSLRSLSCSPATASPSARCWIPSIPQIACSLRNRRIRWWIRRIRRPVRPVRPVRGFSRKGAVNLTWTDIIWPQTWVPCDCVSCGSRLGYFDGLTKFPEFWWYLAICVTTPLGWVCGWADENSVGDLPVPSDVLPSLGSNQVHRNPPVENASDLTRSGLQNQFQLGFWGRKRWDFRSRLQEKGFG